MDDLQKITVNYMDEFGLVKPIECLQGDHIKFTATALGYKYEVIPGYIANSTESQLNAIDSTFSTEKKLSGLK